MQHSGKADCLRGRRDRTNRRGAGKITQQGSAVRSDTALTIEARVVRNARPKPDSAGRRAGQGQAYPGDGESEAALQTDGFSCRKIAVHASGLAIEKEVLYNTDCKLRAVCPETGREWVRFSSLIPRSGRFLMDKTVRNRAKKLPDFMRENERLPLTGRSKRDIIDNVSLGFTESRPGSRPTQTGSVRNPTGMPENRSEPDFDPKKRGGTAEPTL